MLSITPGQMKQVVRFMEDGIDSLRLSQEEAQRVIEHGGDMQAKLKDIIRELSLSSQFADEEVKANYGYPEHHKVKGITEQTNILRRIFPDIGSADNEIADQPLPKGAEGWFAIPRWEKIAPTYNEAAQKVLAAIASRRNFHNYCEGKLGAEYLRQSEQTVQMMWKTLGEQQKGDILVVPAQFGLRHRGRSVRRARAVFSANEFGLGSFAVGIMLLTHPERLENWTDLFSNCIGDEYSLEADGRFVSAPYFIFHEEKVRFGRTWVGFNCGRSGSASGFVPQ